jgi:hypothetical protein
LLRRDVIGSQFDAQLPAFQSSKTHRKKLYQAEESVIRTGRRIVMLKVVDKLHDRGARLIEANVIYAYSKHARYDLTCSEMLEAAKVKGVFSLTNTETDIPYYLAAWLSDRVNCPPWFSNQLFAWSMVRAFVRLRRMERTEYYHCSYTLLDLPLVKEVSAYRSSVFD